MLSFEMHILEVRKPACCSTRPTIPSSGASKGLRHPPTAAEYFFTGHPAHTERKASWQNIRKTCAKLSKRFAAALNI